MKAFFKLSGDLEPVPHDKATLNYIARRKPGEIICANIKRVRNYEFHKKIFALFKVVYENLPEQKEIEFNGKMITPELSQNSVRKYLIVMAGYYDVIGYPNGTVRTEAKSLSYESMEPEVFEKCYSDVINAALKLMGETWKGKDLDQAVKEIMRFT